MWWDYDAHGYLKEILLKIVMGMSKTLSSGDTLPETVSRSWLATQASYHMLPNPLGIAKSNI